VAFEENNRLCDRGGNNEQLMLVTRALEQLMKGKKPSDGVGSSGSGKKGGGGGDGRADHSSAGSASGKDKGRKKSTVSFQRFGVSTVMSSITLPLIVPTHRRRSKQTWCRKKPMMTPLCS
jgi:hypothetical protein